MSSTEFRFKVTIIAPTCFYYQTALFRELSADARIDLSVYFCSDEGLSAKDVTAMYGVVDTWGIHEELLEGYHFKFLRNYSPRPSYLKWPFGLINFGIVKEIIMGRPDVVILMSWMNPTWWMALAACVVSGTPYLYMTDANVQIEPLRSKRKRKIKQLILGRLLFKLSSGFLCAGTANDHFYRMYGVPENKLFPFAYSWGYDSLVKISMELKPQRDRIRSELGITQDSLVILYSGRLSIEKNLFNLMDSYHQLDHCDKSLVIVGDGVLRQSLQDYVKELGAGSVHFVGFRDRNQIVKYYTISDLLILPSVRETWGIVVNEALCFGLPVIVSQQVGAGIDLVTDGQNGYSFGGDVDSLSRSINRFAELSGEERLLMGMRSVEAINDWIDRDLAEVLVQCVQSIKGQQPV